MIFRVYRHTYGADMSLPAERDTKKRDVTHNSFTIKGQDRKDVIIVDVLGPGFDNLCVSDVVA